jgi:hypothetical protein
VNSKARAWDFRFDDFPDRTNLDLTEGTVVERRMCCSDSGYRINCSRWQKATS